MKSREKREMIRIKKKLTLDKEPEEEEYDEESLEYTVKV
jgi:hypothetical protein